MPVTTSDRTIAARGLHFHVREWLPDTPATSRTVYLVHGFADAVRTWDPVGHALAARGVRVLGHDQRGFGETSWVSDDGYYHFFDYVADLDALLDQAGDDVLLVGHSMGGTVACLYAGTRPGRLRGLALLEGLGPPDSDPSFAPDRAERWLDDLKNGPRAKERRYGGPKDALSRLAKQHAGIPEPVLEAHLPALVVGPDDALAWRMDPLHRTMAPVPFYAAAFKAFSSRVRCPTWLVDGGPTGFHPEDEADRKAAFRDVRERAIPDAGHMMHWTRPAELADILAEAALGA